MGLSLIESPSNVLCVVTDRGTAPNRRRNGTTGPFTKFWL